MSGVRPELEWFEKADQDMEMARRALGPEQPLPAMACYHAQQCAEKYFKGFLTNRSVRFRFVHDLIYLTQLCKEQDSAFEKLMPAAEILSEHGTWSRYPMEDEEEPDEPMARNAIRLAEQVVAFVAGRAKD